MDKYACTQLSDPSITTGQVVCEQWELLPEPTFLGLPDISQAQAEQLMIPILLALVTITGIKYAKRALL